MMAKGVIHSAITGRKVTLFSVLIIVIIGLYSYYILPKQEAPEIAAPVAIINTVYPGASPEEVERMVTEKIEDELTEIEGYDYSQSYSRNSLSTVVLWLTNDVDVDKAWGELRRKMDDLQSKLPEECFNIDVNTRAAETAGIILSFSSKNRTYEEISLYVDNIKKELSKIDGVSRFEITGKQDKEVKVEVEASKLNQYGVSLEEIAGIIKVQNLDIPSGSIGNGEYKINVRTPGAYKSLEDIENIVISASGENGSLVRLKDVAKVYMGNEESNYVIKQDGDNAILLTGYFKTNKNIVLIGKKVYETLETLKKGLPDDVIISEPLYQPHDVNESVKGFVFNLLQGILFVVITVFIGMGIRNAIIVSTAIPLSILATFAAMNLLGIKIHQISIAALIIALGMLVDNAIVITDSIQVHFDSGEEKIDACVNGTKEVAIPVLTSTLTTVAAFIPLLLLPGVAGEYIASIPQLIMISLSVSYLVALFVTPTMAYLFFKKSTNKEKTGIVRKFFEMVLQKAMRRKKQTVMVTIAFFLLAGYLATFLNLQFFPKADKNVFYLDIYSERSSDLSKTEDITNKVIEILKQQEEITSTTAAIGDGLPRFYIAMGAKVKSQDFAQVMVKVDLKKGKRFKTNTQFVDYLQSVFDTKISGGIIKVNELEQGEPIGAPVQIRIAGENISRLKEVAEEVKIVLKGINGTVNIDDDSDESTYELTVDIDVDTASAMGISKYDIQNEINIALGGRKTSIYRTEANEYNIVITSSIEYKEELENLAIKSSVTGNKVLLKQIAQIKMEPQQPVIKKYDRERVVTVTSNVKQGYSPVNIEATVQKLLSDMHIDDVKVVFDGEREKIVKYFGDIGVSAIFAILLIYFILIIQFNSLKQPLVILLTVPLSVVGVVFGLLLFRQPLSFVSLLGVVSLFGIVVNNAIVLIDFINYERRQGKTMEDACSDAVEKRFRPIMLTTITTVIGLVPLAISRSSLFTPMSISLMSGLTVSTLLTLVVIPVVYNLTEGKNKNER